MVYRFSKKEYIQINNPQGGGADISSFSEKKACGQKGTFVNIGKIKDKDSTQEPSGSGNAKKIDPIFQSKLIRVIFAMLKNKTLFDPRMN